jgi:uncharacterized protein with GYD domain
MPLYLTLAKYTEEGRKNIDQAPVKYKDFVNLVESKEGKLIGAYGLMGEWDIATITEFPDDKTAMTALMKLGKAGRIATQTMNAIHMEDFVTLAKNV